MKLRALAVGLVLAAASSLASAAAYTVTLNPTTPHHLTASFGATPVLGSFTDVFTFTPDLAPGSSGYALFFNVGLDASGQPNPAFALTFSAADINGAPLYINNFLSSSQAGGAFFSSGGPLVLTVSGVSTGGSYSGLINVTTPVPEPETYGMMLAGLALVGVVARRKLPS